MLRSSSARGWTVVIAESFPSPPCPWLARPPASFAQASRDRAGRRGDPSRSDGQGRFRRDNPSWPAGDTGLHDRRFRGHGRPRLGAGAALGIRHHRRLRIRHLPRGQSDEDGEGHRQGPAGGLQGQDAEDPRLPGRARRPLRPDARGARQIPRRGGGPHRQSGGIGDLPAVSGSRRRCWAT